MFPLRAGPHEQVNLLYAVSFLRGPEVVEFSPNGGQVEWSCGRASASSHDSLDCATVRARQGRGALSNSFIPLEMELRTGSGFL